MHRRPLGRGRTLAALAAPLIVIGCILPWWRVGGTPGITEQTGNGFEGSGILVFLVGMLALALVALPYASGDRPLALDRWLSFAVLAVAGWIGLGWQVLQLALIGAFQFHEPTEIVTNGPGIWLAAIGLIVLSRAVYEMASEPTRR
jgi:hypothetical protein